MVGLALAWTVLAWATQSAALFEDQAGELDWKIANMGGVQHALYHQRRAYVLTAAGGEGAESQSVVAALNARTGELEWRVPLPLGEVGDALALTPTALVTLSDGGRRARAWRLGDGQLLWDAATPEVEGGCETEVLVVQTVRKGSQVASCVVVVMGGDALLALDCASGASVAGWPWYAEAEDDSRLAQALALSGFAGARVRLTGALATLDGHVLVCGTVAGSAAFVAQLDPLALGGGVAESAAASVIPTTQPLRSVALLSRPGSAQPLLLALAGDEILSYDAVACLRATGASKPLSTLTRVADSVLGGRSAVSLRVERNSAQRVARVSAHEGGATRFVVAQSEQQQQQQQSGKKVRSALSVVGSAACFEDCALGAFATPSSAASGSGEPNARVFVGVASSSENGTVAVSLSEAETGAPVSAEAFQNAPLYTEEHGCVKYLFPHVFEKPDATLGFRALVTTRAVTVALLASGKVTWHRDEALAGVSSAEFVDAPRAADHSLQDASLAAVTDLDLPKRLGMQLDAAFAWLTDALSNARDLIAGDSKERVRATKTANARLYGLDKLAIVHNARAGRVLAVSMHSGELAWSRLVPVNALVLVTRSDGQNPELSVLEKGSLTSTRLCAHSGNTLGEEAAQVPAELATLVRTGIVEPGTGREIFLAAAVATADAAPALTLVPASAGAALAFANSLRSGPFHLHVVDRAAGTLRSFMAATVDESETCASGLSAVELGSVRLATAPASILDVAYAKFGDKEPISSKAHILGDDALLLKYLNPHLAVVISASPGGEAAPLLDAKLRTAGEPPVEPPSLYVTLVDTVAARVVYRAQHPHGSGPARALLTENWVVYSYWNAKAKRSELGALSLHEGMIDRYGLSPFKVPEQEAHFSSWSAPPPVALQRTFALARPVVALSATLTARGISSKHVLVGVAPGQLAALDRRSLDPRRPTVDEGDSSRSARKRIERELTEGLQPYAPFVPLKPRQFVTNREVVAGLREVWSTPAKLESTSLLLAAGLDLYGSRYTPSGAFDVLAEDFQYGLLLLLLAALGGGALLLRNMALRKNLALSWA